MMIMFNKIIKIERKENIRYGTTKISNNKTIGEIMDLLDKHGCDKTLLMKEKGGYDQIGFEIEGNPYLFTIPAVYVKGELNECIGPRLIKYFLEVILELTKSRAIDLSTLLLGSRCVRDEKGRLTNVTDYLLPQIENQMLLGTGREENQEKGFTLPEEEDYIDA